MDIIQYNIFTLFFRALSLGTPWCSWWARLWLVRLSRSEWGRPRWPMRGRALVSGIRGRAPRLTSPSSGLRQLQPRSPQMWATRGPPPYFRTLRGPRLSSTSHTPAPHLSSKSRPASQPPCSSRVVGHRAGPAGCRAGRARGWTPRGPRASSTAATRSTTSLEPLTISGRRQTSATSWPMWTATGAWRRSGTTGGRGGAWSARTPGRWSGSRCHSQRGPRTARWASASVRRTFRGEQTGQCLDCVITISIVCQVSRPADQSQL